VLTFSTNVEVLASAAESVGGLVAAGRIGGVTIERIDGIPALQADGPQVDTLLAAGFCRNPRGLRLRR